VGAFRKIYGGNKNRGTRTEHFQKASGGLIRSILHNLESMGVVAKMEDGCARPPPPAPAQ
jgi:small subunit ribosomal protein S19e